MQTRLSRGWRYRAAGFFGSLLLFMAAITPQLVSAQAAGQGTPAERVTVSPAKAPFTLNAGGETKDQLIVINDGPVAYDFKMYAAPYWVKGEAYEPVYSDNNPAYDASRWVQFAQSSYHLDAGHRVAVDYSIIVPTNARPGGHYAVLFAETQPSKNGGAIISKKRVGTLLLATITGETVSKGSFLGDTTAGLQLYAPLSASYRISNDGNVDFAAHTKVAISDLFGHPQFSAEKDFTIFPGTTRKVVNEWSGAPYFGGFKVEQTVQYLGKTEHTSRYVFMVPAWLIIGVMILIALAIAALVAKARSKRS